MMSQEVEIRRALTIADYQACQEAQRKAWGITDDSYVVPLATLVGANMHGGLVLGAFTDRGDAVGLSFAFLGKVEGRPCLYSQLTGVVPGQQGHGLGGRLKQYQREFARSEGIPSLAWSFDPLQSGNARFNLGRLGAKSSRYIEDMYGRRTDALNAGATTDRLIVEWASDPSRETPIEIDDLSKIPRLIETRVSEGGSPTEFDHLDPSEIGPIALLEIPQEIASLRIRDPALAEGWSRSVRRAFLEAFAAGYRAEGFARDDLSGSSKCYYVLARSSAA
ncbi:hypothetical protein P12x_004244 [Tundrisphaera lichenicola]|uniref:hypothetical protein n=1 Tax=Tundrisphaera lichenicola TaxID=2029860 RepID=UPI003EB967D1